MTATKANGRTPRIAPAASDQGNTEPEPRSLDEALLAFQAEAPKLTRDAVGQIQSRTYGYTTLGGLLDDVTPLLAKFKLLWKTRPTTGQDGQPAVRYTMVHVPSGQQDEDVVPLPMVRPDPQAFGSALTYMRRYALQAYLNLAPGEDDDGAAAGVPISAPQMREENRNPTATAPPPSRRPASVSQRNMLRARARDAGLTNQEFANVLLLADGAEPVEWSDSDAAGRYLARNLDRFPAESVTPAVEMISQATT